MKKVACIFGTRPEAIKMAPIILELRKHHEIVHEILVTAQHRQMLDQVLDLFGLCPNADLNLMRPSQTLDDLTARALVEIGAYLDQAKPDLVLIQGDTTTVLSAALAAFYRRIPVGHVEAGLRTGNIYSPWPEEANRKIVSTITALHFAPTEEAKANLLREGVGSRTVFVTGNPVIDALLIARHQARSDPPEIAGLPERLQPRNHEPSRPMVLITGHRRENFGSGFESICEGIAELARLRPEVDFIYPVHLNPNVREPVIRLLGTADGGSTAQGSARNIYLIDPLSYLPFVALMDRATVILTDSGGVQEEAPSLGVPVLVMRETTERPEAIAAGTARLVGTDRAKIVASVIRILDDPQVHHQVSGAANPYGDGRAASRIVNHAIEFLGA